MAPDELLACGASATDVAATALDSDDGTRGIGGHGSSCTHCRARHQRERTRWSRISAELTRPDPAPPRVRRAVLRRVVSARRGTGIVTGAGRRGRTTVTEGVLADLAVRAAGSTLGVEEVTGIEVRVGDGPVVDLSLRVTARLDWSRPLPQLAEAVRHVVAVHLAAIAEVSVGRMAVTFTDLVE